MFTYNLEVVGVSFRTTCGKPIYLSESYGSVIAPGCEQFVFKLQLFQSEYQTLVLDFSTLKFGIPRLKYSVM